MQYLNLNSNLKQGIEGRLSCFNLSPELADAIETEAKARQINPDLVHKPWIKTRLNEFKAHQIFEQKNQIVKEGHLIYLNRGPQSVSRIAAGTQLTPTASTYTTQQTLQAPITSLLFPRIGSWEIQEITNGYQFSFSFRRPVSSSPGVSVTELALKVIEGVNEANLARIVSPSAGLPHTFSATDDTLIVWDIRITV